MPKKMFIVGKLESDLPPRYWKYLRLFVMAWTNRSSAWTKKARAKRLSHAEKLRKHVGWMCKRDWPECNQWSIKSMGSTKYMDLALYNNVQFLLIVE